MNQFDIDLENAVLGAILVEPVLSGITAFQILKTEVFFKNENKLVYGAINALNGQNLQIDLLTVITHLKKNGVVTLDEMNVGVYVTGLMRNAKSFNSLEGHCQILYQYYLMRELNKLGIEIQSKAQSNTIDCFDLIGDIEKQIQTLTSLKSNSFKHIREVHKEVVLANYDVLENEKPTGVYSGIQNLDNITGGWQNGNLIIIAARPGMGKSAFALQLAKHPAMKMGLPVAMFSMEMNNHETGSRLFASETHLNNTKINHKKLTHNEILTLENGCQDLINANIYLEDKPNLSISDIKNMARKMYYEKGVRLFIVDYLQLASSGDGRFREKEISEISRGLKVLAKELNVPIISLAQLSRKPEERPDKRPILSDLRESGAIEQDADIVIFLFRPKEYELFNEGYPFAGMTLQNDNLLIIDIAKGRGIQTTECVAKFYGEQMIVTNYNY